MMKKRVIALVSVALAACSAEVNIGTGDPPAPKVDPDVIPVEAPDETPKAKTVAFKIDGMS